MSDGFSVLVAEDDEGHATLIRRNLQRGGLGSEPIRVRDGQELLDYLYRKPPFDARSHHERIALIVDLNMPRLNGFDVLQRLKHDADLCRIPVYVLTTTDNPHELDRCYALGAAAYLVKPVDYGSFSDLIRNLAQFLATARLPAE